MAVTPTPIFRQAPVSQSTPVSATAQTQRTQFAAAVPTNGVLISPATNTNGIQIDAISVSATGTTLSGLITIWLYDGTNSNLIDEFTISAVTPSTTSPGFTLTKTYANLYLAPSMKLYACSTVASQLANVNVWAGAY